MIEAGVLERPRVDEVYGLHVTTQTAVGHVGLRPGPAMASADFFDVVVTGPGGHGAYPHLSMDPITAAANILVGMQNLVPQEVAAQETAVLTVGQFVGGTKHNIIPASAFRVGIAPLDGRPHPHRAPEFEMNEDGLPVGLRVGLDVMLTALRG